MGDITVITESERQREHLETLGSKLKVQLREEGKQNKTENARLVEENLALINQIKSLREAIQVLRSHIKNVEVERARHSHTMAARSLAAASAAQRSLASTASGSIGGRHPTNNVPTTASFGYSPTSSLGGNDRYSSHSPNQHNQNSTSPYSNHSSPTDQGGGFTAVIGNRPLSTSSPRNSTSPKHSPTNRSPTNASVPHPIHTVTHDLVQEPETKGKDEETTTVEEVSLITTETTTAVAVNTTEEVTTETTSSESVTVEQQQRQEQQPEVQSEAPPVTEETAPVSTETTEVPVGEGETTVPTEETTVPTEETTE